MATDKCFLIIGGGGMIGYQVAYNLCQDRETAPDKIIIASLYQREVQEAIRELKRQAPGTTFVPFWGNVFVRCQFAREDRSRLIESPQRWPNLYEDLFGNLEIALAQSQLATLILDHKPDVIIDAVNTASAISYQDVATTSARLQRSVNRIQHEARGHATRIKDLLRSLEDSSNEIDKEQVIDALGKMQNFLDLFRTQDREVHQESLQTHVETLILSQAVPQLIRHVLLLYEAMKRAGTRLYIKIGTTGTGGMGLNIPYTHSEAKPSAMLMSKTAVAFAQTGLLFLMARTPDAPIVKEIKPAAMVGYQKIARKTVKRRDGSPRLVYPSRMCPVGATLRLRLPEREFESETESGKKHKLEMVGVDTGENGFFALGEFEAITNIKQMEFTTPEEIAEAVVLEIKGRNTGLDVIAGLNSTVMNPSYRAGFLRHLAVDRVRELELRVGGAHSVALRDLGPPELSKLLYEAHLLALEYGTLAEVSSRSPEEMAAAAERRLNDDVGLRDQITSIGIPILFPDGKNMWRGPLIAYPEGSGQTELAVDPDAFEQWISKGWIDLRPKNFQRWRERIEEIVRKRREQLSKSDEGSATFNRTFYPYDDIRIGEMVGWIFNNGDGYRIIG